MKFITVNDVMYVVRGTVLAEKVINISTNELKNRYSIADTVLRNGDSFYICMKVIDAEYVNLK